MGSLPVLKMLCLEQDYRTSLGSSLGFLDLKENEKYERKWRTGLNTGLLISVLYMPAGIFEHGSKSSSVCLDIRYPFQPLPLPIQSRRQCSWRRFSQRFLAANEILSVSSQDETDLLSPRSTSFDSPPFSNQKVCVPLPFEIRRMSIEMIWLVIRLIMVYYC